MRRSMAVIALMIVAAGFAFADGKASEESLLAELKKLAGPLPRDKDNLDAEELKEEYDKRGKQALDLATKFEAEFPKSKSLDDARLLALKALSHSHELATAKEPLALAKRLREATAKGSDHAAQADLFIIGADIRVAIAGAKSREEFAKAWNKDAEGFRKKIAQYLEDHPKYAPAADSMGRLLTLLEIAGDTKTRDLILDSIAKNLPDHPLAKGQALRKAVGQEFDLKFTPAGSDKEVSLKDLRGKVVVVNFWASWCQPCTTELKQLKELYEKHHKEGLEIVGFSLDEKDTSAQRFVKKNKIEWRQVIGKAARAVGEKYGIESVPAEFVIDRDGKLHSVQSVGKLPEIVAKLLEKK